MIRLLALAIPILLVAFWIWMFNDMLNNDDIPSSEPPGFRWPPQAKNQWIIFFIVFNIFTAGYYYFTEYNRRRDG
jgi:hypothetical protein